MHANGMTYAFDDSRKIVALDVRTKSEEALKNT